jgi:hypothetical protein
MMFAITLLGNVNQIIKIIYFYNIILKDKWNEHKYFEAFIGRQCIYTFLSPINLAYNLFGKTRIDKRVKCLLHAPPRIIVNIGTHNSELCGMLG